jgi:hypothetical protein
MIFLAQNVSKDALRQQSLLNMRVTHTSSLRQSQLRTSLHKRMDQSTAKNLGLGIGGNTAVAEFAESKHALT